MATIRELVTILGFDVKDGPLKKYESGIARAKNAALNLTKAFAAVGAVGGGLFFLTKRVANLGDTIGETAQKIGINAEALQKFQFIGKQSGIAQGQLNSGIKLFGKNIGNAINKNEKAIKVSKNFTLGLRAQNGQLKTTDQLILEVADKFASMQDGPEKTAAALKLFGRAGSEMIPMLNKGGKELSRVGDELKAMGIILSDETIKRSDEFNDSLELSQGIIGGYANLLGAEMMPVFQEAADSFIDWAKETAKTGDAQKAIKKIAKELSDVIRTILGYVKDLVKELPEMTKALGGAEGILKKLVAAFGAWVAFNLVSLVGNLAFAYVQLAAAIKLSGVSLAFLNKGMTAFAAVGAGTAMGVILGNLILLAYDYADALNGSVEAQNRVNDFARERSDFINQTAQGLGLAEPNQDYQQNVDAFWTLMFSAGEKFSTFMNNIWRAIGNGVFQFIKSPLDGMWLNIKGIWKAWGDAATAAFLLIGNGAKALATSIIESLGGLSGIMGYGGFNGQLNPGQGNIPGPPSPTSLLNQGPSSLGSGATKSVTNNQDVQVASTVTVNVQSQADPNALATAANDAVKTAWNSSLRQAQRALQAGEAVG